MGKTISGRIGGGSTGHNSREYSTNNVDQSRTHLNIDYCNEPIKEVYHKLPGLRNGFVAGNAHIAPP